MIFMTLIRFSMFAMHYTFDSGEYMENIGDITKNAECIFTSAEYAEMWMMDYLPADIYYADKVFVTYIGGQDDCKQNLESLKTDKPIYLLLNIPSYSYFDDDNPLEAFYYIDHYDTNTKQSTYTKIDKKDFENKVTSFYKNLSITKNFEYIGEHNMFTRTYKVYRLA